MKLCNCFVFILFITILCMACSNETGTFNNTTLEDTTLSITTEITTNVDTTTNISTSSTPSSTTKSYGFVDNHILISINHEESLKFTEYTQEDFFIEDILEIRDLTSGYKNKIENDPTYDSSRFKRIILLIMDYHDCERILEDIETIKEHVNFISSVNVDGYTSPSS